MKFYVKIRKKKYKLFSSAQAQKPSTSGKKFTLRFYTTEYM